MSDFDDEILDPSLKNIIDQESLKVRRREAMKASARRALARCDETRADSGNVTKGSPLGSCALGIVMWDGLRSPTTVIIESRMNEMAVIH
jgi:hypothetical protein